MTTQRTAVIAISDTHINSTVSLIAPVIALDDGGEYHASREQRRLWEWFGDFCQWAKDSTEGYRRVGVIVGDVGELDTKRRSVQIISANKATIQSAVLKTLEPFFSLLDATIVIRGTPAHTGKGAWLEEWLANDLGGKSFYHYRGQASGVRFDIGHHSSMGRLPWTEKLAATKIAAEAVMKYALAGEQMPHVMVRAHNHRWNIDRDNYPIHCYMLGAWTYATEYTYRIGQYGGIASIGGGVWLCQEGQYEWKKREYTIPKAIRKIWSLTM